MKTKSIIITTLALLLTSLTAQAQTDFYYYKGNKIPLTLNPDKVCVSVPKDRNEAVGRVRANVQVLKTIVDEIFDIIVVSRSDYENLTSLDLWEEDAKSVIITTVYFTENNEEVYATPYLHVRLNKEEDLSLLSSYAEQYGLNIIRQNLYMPLWYTLCVTTGGEKNSVNCANELYESGVFPASVPDLIGAVHFNDETSVRNTIATPTEESSALYNLQGQRLTEIPSKGIVIRDGRKVIVK